MAKQHGNSTLRAKSAIAIPTAAATILSSIYAPGILQATAAAFTLIATWEVWRALERRVPRAHQERESVAIANGLVLVLCLMMWAWMAPETYWFILPLAFAALAASLRHPLPRFLGHVEGVTVLALFYVGGLMGAMIALYSLPLPPAFRLMALGGVIASDSLAQIIGGAYGRKLFKRPPPVQHISPQKSWEGFIAAGFGPLAVNLIIWLTPLRLPLGQTVALSCLIGIAAPLGDLAGSRIKRNTGIDNYSNLLGAHGGAFDRLDSLCVSMAITYLLATAMLALS